MDAIVLFSHGSLLCGSGEALREHATRLLERGVAPIVEVGYLNYSEPSFADSVARCVAAGASRVIVTPYFLVPGYFVQIDLPKCVEAASAAHPGIDIVVADPIGYDERLADALILSARVAAGPDHWRDDLKCAAAHCRPDPRCPLYGTPDCPKQPEPASETVAAS
jgi:sirohydrochlorin ferrochelatase